MRKFLVLTATTCILMASLVGCKGKEAETELSATEKRIQKIEKKLKKASVGDVLTIGSYEQDNNSKNGSEAVEWIVLDKQEKKVLLVSKYGLDCKQYHDEETETTWETSSIREWLNEEFLDEIFNEAERSFAADTVLNQPAGMKYGIDGGNETTDKMFLLSMEEATKYFDSDPDECDKARRIQPTEYAKSQGAMFDTEEGSEYLGNCRWWLRTPGEDKTRAAEALADGYISQRGLGVIDEGSCIRPAIWLEY